jgi:hypothetical protein
MTITTFRSSDTGLVLLRQDGELIGYIDRFDGEIMLFEGVINTFTDDELLYVMQIGMKPELHYPKQEST